jgi:hypothetical protein
MQAFQKVLDDKVSPISPCLSRLSVVASSDGIFSAAVLYVSVEEEVVLQASWLVGQSTKAALAW